MNYRSEILPSQLKKISQDYQKRLLNGHLEKSNNLPL